MGNRVTYEEPQPTEVVQQTETAPCESTLDIAEHSETDDSYEPNFEESDFSDHPLCVNDIISVIFSFLDTYTMMDTVPLVCKTWNRNVWFCLQEFVIRADYLYNQTQSPDYIQNVRKRRMLLHRVAKFATYLTRFDVFGASMDENLHSLINDTVINYLITREDINKSYFQYVDAFTENKFSCELVRLSLPECNTITPIGFGILSSSDDIRNKLLYLDVSGSYAVTDTILKEHISKFSSLKELKLSRCHYVSYPHIEELQSLTSLDMCGMKNVQDFSPINKLVQLRTLRLSNCPHLNDLSMLSDLSHLQVLDVNDTSIARLYHTSLTELNIGHCRLLEDPNELLPLQNITKLNMSYSYLNEGLFELCMWSRLVSLIMREADKKLLAPLNQFLVGTPLLEEIDLYRCDVGDKLINSIANNCPRMRKLSIMYCSNVTNVDSLRVLDQLVELNVSYTSVMSSHFFDMVSQMPSMNKLHVHGADANLAAALVSRLARSGRIITVLCEK